MNIFLTIKVSRSSFQEKELKPYVLMRMSDILINHNFDFLKNDYSLRLKFLAQDISNMNSDIIVFGNPCYDVNDIKILKNELLPFNLKITGFFVPNESNLDEQFKEAISESKKFGSHFGDSEIEIKRAFDETKIVVAQISNYCKENGIELYFK